MLEQILAGVTAFGTVVTAAAVVIGVLQLRTTQQQLELLKRQARTSFEDDLFREYRSIVGDLPTEAFYRDIDSVLTSDYRRPFFRYFDLSNEQLFLMRQGRISPETAEQWRDGIKGNLRLPAFWRAWIEIADRIPADFFDDLRELVRHEGPARSQA